MISKLLGDEKAYRALGFWYMNGTGVNQDCDKAVRIFQDAAFRGSISWIYRLANYFFLGIGVRQDEFIAIRLWKYAAGDGRSEARLILDSLDESGTFYRDVKEALEILGIAAELGVKCAQISFGALYEDENGVEKNPAEAALLFIGCRTWLVS